MAHLFLDTSYFLIVGLLDEDYRWIDYQIIRQQKNSQIIHQQIYQLLQRHHLILSQIQQIYTIAGPGSYTGVRLAAGMAQILELEARPQVFSFYHFQIPQLLGQDSGIWMCPAFKGEYFLFDLATSYGQTISLLATQEILGALEPQCLLYTAELAIQREIGGEAFWRQRQLQETSTLIHEQSAELFAQVRALQLRLEPFFFRPEEKEFSLPRKGNLLGVAPQ